jgi:hypothetical protein
MANGLAGCWRGVHADIAYQQMQNETARRRSRAVHLIDVAGGYRRERRAR